MERIGIERLSGLVAFAKAGSLGSFAAPARALSLTPSAVSKGISRLEQQLGLTLLNRTTRSLALTEDGKRIHEVALRMLNEAEAIEQIASGVRTEPSGILRIAASFPIAVHVVAPALADLQNRHPDLRVDLVVEDAATDLVAENIDIAIRIGTLQDSSLKFRRLPPHRLCCHASPDYLREKGEPQTPDELATHRTLGLRYKKSGLLFRWPFTIDGRIAEMSPACEIVGDASEALVAAAVAGAGIAMCADFMVTRKIECGQLVPILQGFAVERQDIAALWPESRNSNPGVRAFLDHIAGA